ncbi:MAG: phenylalanine--tRNA ligase subunit beta [Chitinivibrionales bacterium]|nr:phenylalanine--tRNA ligase subunit beta [Chitinivibrionales bacterium]
MKISYNWLKDFVDIDADPEQLTGSLTTAGLEIESLSSRSVPDGVVVARVVSVEKHPNADKLSLCTVDTGGGNLVRIVCGAPNVREGLIAPLATEGTVIGPDMLVKKTKIRGVESSGMLCSERELGISDDHSGLMELDETYAPGTRLRDVFPDDHVFDLEITPDRGDCLSIKGVAREVAAITGKPLKAASRSPVESGESVDKQISVKIHDAQRCPRYMGRLVTGVTIAPSPAWLKQRLSACGLRPINNVVDVTNYILLQFGQPMHAFDYAKIRGKTITVDRVTKDRTYTTLDGVERSLVDGDLLICDAEGPVALAGIMGGAGSEISDATTDVFLECAYFQPAGIRRTSKRLGLSTESSYRFERGVDPESGLEEALDTAAELIRELGGGEVAAGVIDAQPEPMPRRTITLRLPQVKRVLGIEVGVAQARAYLEGLGMVCTAEDRDTLTFDTPLFRHDIEQEIDLVEEIGRLYGYDNIPTSEYAEVNLTTVIDPLEKRSDALRNALAYFGLNELVTNTMTSDKIRALLTPDREAVTLLNPISPEMAQMRTTLLGSHLQVLAHNLNRKSIGNRYFELGAVYLPRPGEKLPEERTVLGVLIEGDYVAAGWQSPAVQSNFFVLKGVLEHAAALGEMGAMQFEQCPEQVGWFDDEAAAVRSDKGVTGVAGKVRREILDWFDIKSTVYYAELDIEAILHEKPTLRQFEELPRFPAVERDFAFVMPEEITAGTVEARIRGISDLVEAVSPFDVYRGEKLADGHKSIAFSVRLRSRERTLTDQEAEKVSQAIIEDLRAELGLELR